MSPNRLYEVFGGGNDQHERIPRSKAMIVQLSQHWRLSLSVLLIVSFTQMVYGAPLPVSAPEEVGLSSE